jgi:Domain of unknown function (DUF4253)
MTAACGLASRPNISTPQMEITTLKVPGVDALRILAERRAQFAATGEYPFLIGSGEEIERLQETADFNTEQPAEIIRSALGIQVDDWFAACRERAEKHNDAELILGDWPRSIPQPLSLTLHTDILTGKVLPTVHLGLAKIEHFWQLPAVLKYGDWNDCPSPEVHCALHRSWQNRFGAEIAGVSGDVIECIVENPPTDRESATALAWEQYWYCGDIVDQGCGKILNLAATLLNSRNWYFWWD